MPPVLTDSSLKDLLKQLENEVIERCESPKVTGKIAKAICAFSNDMAGHNKPCVIFVGLKDDGAFCGLAVTDEILKNLSSFRSDGNLLPFPVMSVRRLTVDSQEVAALVVQPSQKPPMRYRGRCYVRIGPSVRVASSEEEQRLTEKRQAYDLPYDMQGITGATVEEDLNREYFKTQYLPAAVSKEVLEENKRPLSAQMQSLRLMNFKDQPTAAAILVMGINPRNFFPGAYIQFVRFEEGNLTDPVRNQTEVSGTLPDQITRMEEILKANISTSLKLTDTTHVQSSDYPFEALSQLLRNALIHRNYNSYTPVRVHWFSDRVEIQNPGGPYGELNTYNFGTPGLTSYRNPTITEALKHLGFIERFGFGLVKARKALQENGNPELYLEAKENTVLAVIKARREK